MLQKSTPIFIADKFTECGKWMDGWESRRKRTPGHDWCIIKLGLPGFIRGIEVDTSHFTGNFAPMISVQAALFDKPFKMSGRSEDVECVTPGKMGDCARPNDFESVASLKSEDWTEIVAVS